MRCRRIKSYIAKLGTEVEPDLVLTHWRHDLHQDHRLVGELTWNTFRDHLILEYEIPGGRRHGSAQHVRAPRAVVM